MIIIMPEVLETMFGSKSRARMMRFFILNPGKYFDRATVAEKIQLPRQKLRKDFSALQKIGLIKSRKAQGKKVFILNEQFAYYPELRELFIKANAYPHCSEVKTLKDIGRVKLVMVSGVFLNHTKADLDLLIVGDDISRAKLKRSIAAIEAEIGKEVRYMSLTIEEFDYRLEMMDRFIIEFLAGPHGTIVNRIPRLNRFIAEIKS